MTPKEKAKELVEKYLSNIEDRTGTFILSQFSAKQCAKIAVEEILKAIYGWTLDIRYWNEVLTEIDKL